MSTNSATYEVACTSEIMIIIKVVQENGPLYHLNFAHLYQCNKNTSKKVAPITVNQIVQVVSKTKRDTSLLIIRKGLNCNRNIKHNSSTLHVIVSNIYLDH